MNWIFEAYTNVYKAAMMQDQSRSNHAAPAKGSLEPTGYIYKPFLHR